MSGAPEIVYALSPDGRKVAEAVVAGLEGARALLAAARAQGAELAWAHSTADLSATGYRRVPGYRRMSGPARDHGEGRSDPGIGLLTAADDSPELWARAYRGQWGHRTPEQWPFDLPRGTVTLALRRDGQVVGLCRVDPEAGLIDGPGLAPAYRDPDGYRRLLSAALAAVSGQEATLESWGEPAELTAVAESLGLATEEYVQGWEFDLHN